MDILPILLLLLGNALSKVQEDEVVDGDDTIESNSKQATGGGGGGGSEQQLSRHSRRGGDGAVRVLRRRRGGAGAAGGGRARRVEGGARQGRRGRAAEVTTRVLSSPSPLSLSLSPFPLGGARNPPVPVAWNRKEEFGLFFDRFSYVVRACQEEQNGGRRSRFLDPMGIGGGFLGHTNALFGLCRPR